MRKVGIMGGTFDPIHMGHLIAASSAMEAASLDEVWFIPTATPPLKPNAPLATAEQRLQMVQLAIADQSAFRALDIELSRSGISYSFDTVTRLMSQYPHHQFNYIIGSDRIHDLPTWHRAEELRSLISFIGLNRPSDPLQLDLLSSEWRSKLTIASMPLIGISSTELRLRAEQGLSLQYYVPDSVAQYIRGNRIYG
ncbi:nicotinate-nucleotide adenylyltransferase [Paenibacillus endoradicis]|uniref:nicotinate-nucleotide adenylyltransferase n=1 Tax=Paenibacillus endoradicis TaxID=2972487 RepID=UPI002159A7BC|nr:nicotinate-nucleotide adenylyltransferase [Paenibacillus endoradicis]MCR8655871.1 nicotinate-nucleotide adenylyltransferase [Paenibacillus endoradicis]MCR8658197.1 nicotinate-nucleotide adenylyltransferase [Paenibacillus endoradicis]